MSNDETTSKVQMTKIRLNACLLSFGFRHSFVIRHSAFVICLTLPSLCMSAEPAPSATDILDSVRMIESRQQIDLQGQLRQEDVVIPFRLVQNGPLIRYSFTNPDETLQLRLGENSSRLDLVTGAGTEKAGPGAPGTGSRDDRDLWRSRVQISLLVRRARLRRGKCPHPEVLETSPAPPAVARVAVFQRVAVGRQGERRTDANGGLRLERSIG